jgi:hypothetical protein
VSAAPRWNIVDAVRPRMLQSTRTLLIP